MREEAYRVYVTDSMRMQADRTRYYDIIHPKPEDERTSDEIISSIVGKLKGGEQK